MYEDLNRVKIYIKCKTSGGHFTQGIGVDLNKACQLFESFKAESVTNFDMELDSLDVAEFDERAAPRDSSREMANKNRYFANSIITSIPPLHYQALPIVGIQENEAIGIEIYFLIFVAALQRSEDQATAINMAALTRNRESCRQPQQL